MFKLLVLRLLVAVPLMLFVATSAFFMMQLSPVDPAELILGSTATDQSVAAVRDNLGLDRPAVLQYFDWLTGAVRFDLGESWFTGTDVLEELARRAPVTLSLVFGSLFISLILGVACGTIAAVRAGRLTDRLVSVVASFGLAVPNFWVAILLSYYFAVRLGWFPSIGYVGPTESVFEWLRHIALPCIALGTSAAAAVARQSRSAMIGVLQQDYIRMSLARGLPMRTVVGVHALRNAAIPVVTLAGFQVSALFGGAIFVELVFNMPGMGSMGVDAVLRNNIPVILGFVMVTALVVVVVNIVLDLLYAWLNPRVRPT